MLIAEQMSTQRIVLQRDVERPSFLDALRWLCALGSGVLLAEVFVKPPRPNCVELRVKKRRPKKVPVGNKSSHVLYKRLIQQAVGA